MKIEKTTPIINTKTALKITLSSPQLPETGYLRLIQIIGNKNAEPPIPALLIPINLTSWLNGINSGKYPKPVELGALTNDGCLADDIDAWLTEKVKASLSAK
jgi:prophage regulatory protein